VVELVPPSVVVVVVSDDPDVVVVVVDGTAVVVVLDGTKVVVVVVDECPATVVGVVGVVGVEVFGRTVVVVVGRLTLVAEGTKYSWPSAPLMKVPPLAATALWGG
jgi:hypothetical protein